MRGTSRLPSALAEEKEIVDRLLDGQPAVFLDYDGTLTPIVDDPAKALLSEGTRSLLARLSRRWPVVIMSGRALEDVRGLVGLDDIIYAGSHGFSIRGPDDSFREEPFSQFRPVLEQVAHELVEQVRDLRGVRIERKPYAIALHYRKATAQVAAQLEKRVDAIVSRNDNLRKTGGKKIYELRPNVDWDKGKALIHLLGKLHIDDWRAVPLYIGDDVTDEDAFRAIHDSGIGVLVTEQDQPTAANYVLRDTVEVAVFLEELAKLAESSPATDTWSLIYDGFSPESEKLRETLCTLGNGYLATRGAAPESAAGEVHYPGTYMAGVYNRLVSEVAGHTIENESIVNIPNWLPLSFSAEGGDWFDLSAVEVFDYRQELHMDDGILVRRMEFVDGRSRRTRVQQRRFVHMAHPHLAGLETTITPIDWSGTLCVRSALDGAVDNSLVERYSTLNHHHLEPLTSASDGELMSLEVQTSQSHIRIAEAARTRLYRGGKPVESDPEVIRREDYVAHEYQLHVEAGDEIRIEKTVALHKSGDPATSDCLLEAIDEVRHAGDFESLLQRHALAWKHLWKRWKIIVSAGDPRVEQVLNLHIFHLIQTVSPNTVDLDVGVPPRGLHGEAYRGLIMWDELFIFPLVNLRMPDITRSLLMYRHRRLRRARWAAASAGYRGAMFPWQSGSDGVEQAQTLHLNPASGRWLPDNSALERHIDIAVAYNAWQYYQVTADKDFMAFYGAELMVETALFWASKVTYDETKKRYRILKVMGPDEFHDRYPDSQEAGVDDNAYTNVMVAWLFWRTLETLDLLPTERRSFLLEDLGCTEDDVRQWNRISRNLYVPFHDGVVSQFEGYGNLREFDWEGYRKKYGNIQRLDRILESEGDSTNRYKVSKQADVLMLFYLLSSGELHQLFERLDYEFTRDAIPTTVNYYLERTSHGSTLSRVVHAWVLARSNRPTSWSLFQDALESDIEDIQNGTTREGIHLGAMAGTVDLILRCYSGVESRGDVLWFNPSLPSALRYLQFGITYRGCRLDVDITISRIHVHSRDTTAGPVRVGFGDRTHDLAPGATIEFQLQQGRQEKPNGAP